MFSKFFIKRPIFATVLSLIIVITGIITIRGLPIEEYPQVTPPQVSITATYQGASAETISKTVAAPLEQQINGVENMMYMSSTSSSDGTLTINVYFKIGTDADKATINVNNRVQMALNSLPSEVQTHGVTVTKQSSNFLLLVSLLSPKNTYDELYMSNYAIVNIVDELKRIPGVGNTTLFNNQEYSMRVWLKQDQLAKYNLTSIDVVNAISEQNSQFAAGRLNQTPSNSSQAYTFTVTTQGRLDKVSEFENIILKSKKDGSSLKLKNVASIELGSNSYNVSATQNSQAMVPIGINLQSGANALQTANLVKEKMKELNLSFPKDMTYNIPYDTTRFIEISIKEVIKTFIEALLFVVCIVYLFLQNLRATIIPILAIPVSIIGTFIGMYLLGFSINLLTLFGLVLSIGIVVDDAIIVIENVERILHSNKTISVKEATYEAMSEITRPVIAIVLVLCAVFIPVSFMGGFTGAMYQQFAITIVISVVISGFVALTLTPALCSIFIKKIEPKPFWFVKKFNDFFDKLTLLFTGGVSLIVRHSIIAIVIFATLLGTTYQLFQKVPSSLVPLEDKGYLISATSLPPAASLQRTINVGKQMSDIAKNIPEIEDSVIISGFDIFTGASKTNASTSFFTLKPWSERLKEEQSADSISQILNGVFYEIPDATIFALSAPPIDGLSTSGGFEMYLQDKSGGSLEALNSVVNEIIEKASSRPELSMVRSSFDISIPQYHTILDKDKAKALGVSISDAYKTLQLTLGSYYVNDFNLYGRTYQVNVQSESKLREKPDDLNAIFVKSESGKLIPISSLITTKRSIGADTLDRFNGLSAAKIEGEPALGYTSGDALKAIEEVASQVIPQGYSIAWSGTSYQEKAMQGSGTQAFLLGLVFIFLILAAQYERWLMPLAVITVVPFAVFGAILAVYLRGLGNDIYFQIGLLVLIGLSAKNAILIVEFAMQAQEKGKTILEATLEAARLRFRPIVMTSLAFTIGVLPLAISTGAGAGSRHAIGTGVIGGMIASTTIAIFFAPLFYNWLANVNAKFTKKGKTNEA
ncbi:multidrug efflux RND transporter permease subunit [Aliarcobacter cryaerophilus]|jgi:multidrug efflux pump|uniref:Multidrug efflux RND transporter permease subunit n=2 Tax=Arcobacteraceae TaxID=2808963 RepID=A0AAU0P9C8_9BACT|nr:multidrug efflux RND transporter permease subunit [Aliarcobacter cryaerophilus]WNL18056.1 multidrug efflux RND transporter permease subunit [Arcobacter sp. AZ-2023]WPD04471.1 multidrug efflux RND transporter permease subunit [Arcobacter sp. DSM 115972]